MHGVGIRPGETAALGRGRVASGSAAAGTARRRAVGLARHRAPPARAARPAASRPAPNRRQATARPQGHVDGRACGGRAGWRTARMVSSRSLRGIFPLQALARAVGWILVPPESEGYPAGAMVEVRSFSMNVAARRSTRDATRSARRGAARRAPGAVPRGRVGRGGADALRAASRSHPAAGRTRRACRRARPGARADMSARPTDVPPFDRAGVDGFAVRAADTVGATDAAPRRLEPQRGGAGVRPCAEPRGRAGHRDRDRDRRRRAARRRRGGHDRAHRPGRNARTGPAIDVQRAVGARPVRLLCGLRHRARRDAAAARHAHRLARDRHAGGLRARRRSTSCGGRRSACCRPATNWCSPAMRLRPGAVYDSNGAIIAAAVAEAGGEAVAVRRLPGRRGACSRRRCGARCDLRHGGAERRHLQGRGRSLVSHRLAARRARRDRGPRRRAQAGQAALSRGGGRKAASRCCPGFPPRRSSPSTPSWRRSSARVPASAPRRCATVEATVPVRIASELGRKEFVLVSLVARRGRPRGVSVAQGLGRGDELLAVRRIHRGRCARRRPSTPARRPACR